MLSPLTFSEPGTPLPSAISYPFGIFLDTEEGYWSNDDFIGRSCLELLKSGCRWFACFGLRAEEVHDRIDDLIIEHGFADVITTYHSDETREVAADFFKNVVLMEMKAGLVLVHDRRRWARYF